MATGGVPARARVAHAMPGRVRLRFERPVDVEELAKRLATDLRDLGGTVVVVPKPTTRSIVIEYDPGEIQSQRLLGEGLRAAAVEVLQPGAHAPAAPTGETAVGRTITNAVGTTNASVGRATRGTLDLRDAFPLTLFGLGLGRVLRGQVEPVPWHSLLYYGYSIFSALHAPRGTSEPDAVEIVRRRYARGELSAEEYRALLAELERVHA